MTELDRAFYFASEEPANLPKFLQTLLNCDLYALVRNDDKLAFTDSHTSNDSPRLSMLSCQLKDGRNAILLYTSLEQISEDEKVECKPFQINTKDLFQYSYDKCFIINPNEDNSFCFEPKEIMAHFDEQYLTVSEEDGANLDTALVIHSNMQNLIARTYLHFPIALYKSLIQYFDSTDTVDIAYLVKAKTSEYTRFYNVFVIKLRQFDSQVLRDIMVIASSYFSADHLQQNVGIRFCVFDKKPKLKSHIKPFYRKKRSLLARLFDVV